MKKSFVFACFGAFCAVGAWSVSAAEGVVTADVLNIRTQPDLNSGDRTGLYFRGLSERGKDHCAA